MRLPIKLLLLSLVLSAPYELIKFTISSYIMPNKSFQMQLDVVSPRSPNSSSHSLSNRISGTHAQLLPAGLIDSISEKGFVFMTISKIRSINPQHMTSVVEKIMSWLNDNFKDVMTNRAP